MALQSAFQNAVQIALQHILQTAWQSTFQHVAQIALQMALQRAFRDAVHIAFANGTAKCTPTCCTNCIAKCTAHGIATRVAICCKNGLQHASHMTLQRLVPSKMLQQMHYNMHRKWHCEVHSKILSKLQSKIALQSAGGTSGNHSQGSGGTASPTPTWTNCFRLGFLLWSSFEARLRLGVQLNTKIKAMTSRYSIKVGWVWAGDQACLARAQPKGQRTSRDFRLRALLGKLFCLAIYYQFGDA